MDMSSSKLCRTGHTLGPPRLTHVGSTRLDGWLSSPFHLEIVSLIVFMTLTVMGTVEPPFILSAMSCTERRRAVHTGSRAGGDCQSLNALACTSTAVRAAFRMYAHVSGAG